jgi:hypothetical protein
VAELSNIRKDQYFPSSVSYQRLAEATGEMDWRIPKGLDNPGQHINIEVSRYLAEPASTWNVGRE